MNGGIEQIRDGIDQLLAANLARAGDGEVLQAARDLETQLRRLPAAQHRLIAELGVRHPGGGDFGAGTVTSLLVQELRLSPGEAKARVSAARDLGPRPAV